MARLNINGRKVTVDDSFFQLSPADQDATVDEIAAELGMIPSKQGTDPYNGSFANDGTQGPTFARGGTALPQEKTLGGAGMTWMENAINSIPIVGPSIQTGSDYLGSNLYGLATGQDPAQIREEVNQRRTGRNEAYPASAFSGQMAGAMAGTAPLVAAAPAAFGANGGSMFARSLASAGTGGALGASDAAVRSDFDLKATMKGGGLGLAVGGLSPAIGGAIGRSVNAVTNRFQGIDAASQKIATASSRDGIASIAAALQKLGPDAMPMDLGPNMQRLAGALASMPSKAQETVRSSVATRHAGAGARMERALDKALGQPVNTIAMADDIIARRAAASKPLYDAAYAKPVPFTRELEGLLTRPSAGRALVKARNLAADEGIPSHQWFANIADNGAVTIKNVPDVRQLDLTKRALDDMIAAAGNNEARILTQLKNQIVSQVNRAAPEYAQARRAFSGPSSVLDAIEDGKGIFSKKMTPNELRTHIMKMDEGQKEAFIQGGRAAVADIMGTARNDALAGRNLFASGYNREKLKILVGPERAKSMLDSLDAEQAFIETRNIVMGNSETAARLAAQADIGANTKTSGTFRNVGNMQFGDALAGLGNKATGLVSKTSKEKLMHDMARMLTASKGDTKAATKALQAVQIAQRQGELTQEQARKLIAAITVAAHRRD